jgi:hypothetical protein
LIAQLAERIAELERRIAELDHPGDLRRSG